MKAGIRVRLLAANRESIPDPTVGVLLGTDVCGSRSHALLEAIVDNTSVTSTAHLRTLHGVALRLAAATTGDALNQLEDAEVDWASLNTFDDLMQRVYEAADALG